MGHSILNYEVSKPPRWDTFVAGAIINLVALLLFVTVSPRFMSWVPLEPISTKHYVALVAPVLAPPRVTPPPVVPTRPQVVARLEPPRITPRPVTPQPPRVEPPQVEPPKPEPAKVAAAPPRPAPPVVKKVETNVFGSAGSETATVHLPPREVQTGGFGDPNGIPGKGDPNRKTVTVANLGSFDLPSGPGKGNGTGGAHGVPGTIRSAGFADGVASSGPHGPRGTAVVEGGFGDGGAPAATPVARQLEKKPALQPVEITYKPRPNYTPEARRLRVEGEVLLEVVFSASGSVHVKRVVKGLGHGLDDAAQVAAERIKFRPALRDGQPYDCATLVHIVFELAE